MRGEHTAVKLMTDLDLGIIPACAGSTRFFPVITNSALGSSPHARGAPCTTYWQSIGWGDHPRMRGEHQRLARNGEDVLGIIPACAGSTVLAQAGAVRAGGIIPACAGSTFAANGVPFCAMGSSPHARGALIGHVWLTVLSEDHPRMRGEHHGGRFEAAAQHGIIPACAGSTYIQLAKTRLAQGSSPHARGAPCTTSRLVSSSRDHPRMRGEHVADQDETLAELRIIPACAGSTDVAALRGEIDSGSSPHARGAHLFTCDPNGRPGSFASLYPKRRALCLLLASLQPDFLAP